MSESPNVTYTIEEILKQINQKIDKLQEDVTELKVELKVGQARLEGKIESLDEKINGLSKRLDFQEFINKGIFVSLVVAILGGLIKLFGWFGKP